MNYIIIVHKNDADGEDRYWATVEDLKGCHLAEQTLEALEQAAREVVPDFIALSNADGASYPAPTSYEFRMMVTA